MLFYWVDKESDFTWGSGLAAEGDGLAIDGGGHPVAIDRGLHEGEGGVGGKLLSVHLKILQGHIVLEFVASYLSDVGLFHLGREVGEAELAECCFEALGVEGDADIAIVDSVMAAGDDGDGVAQAQIERVAAGERGEPLQIGHGRGLGGVDTAVGFAHRDEHLAGEGLGHRHAIAGEDGERVGGAGHTVFGHKLAHPGAGEAMVAGAQSERYKGYDKYLFHIGSVIMYLAKIIKKSHCRAIGVALSSFFAHKHVDGGAGEVPVLAYLVLEITLVRLFHPLRQVAEEHKGGGDGILELGYVFDFDKFTLI